MGLSRYAQTSDPRVAAAANVGGHCLVVPKDSRECTEPIARSSLKVSLTCSEASALAEVPRRRSGAMPCDVLQS